MQPAFLTPFFAMAMLVSVAIGGEPRLTKEQVIEIGEIILENANYGNYKEGFSLDKPYYDGTKGIWRFADTGKLYPPVTGAPLYFFEIRDGDCCFRIGSISGRGYSPKSSENFRMSPTIRTQIRELLKKP